MKHQRKVLQGDGHDAKGPVQQPAPPFRAPDQHHMGQCRHFAGQEEHSQ